MPTAKQELASHVRKWMNYGHSAKDSVSHVFSVWPNLVKRAAAEDERRKFENPGRFFMEEMKQYDKGSHDEFVKMAGRLFKENPIFSNAYERQVKGGDDRFERDSAELDGKVREYMKDSGEKDYKTAFNHVRAENPELAESWHFAGARPGKSRAERRYQTKDDIESGSAASRLLAEAKKVRQAIGGTLMDGLMRICKEDRDLAKEVAADWINDRVNEKIGAEKNTSPTRSIVVREIVKEYPSVSSMWNSGAPSEQALREIFGDRI